MLDSYQKSTGTQYTATVALLAIAFIFSPAVLMISRPLSYLSISLALACSALCIVAARMNWKTNSALTIPSLAAQYSRAK